MDSILERQQASSLWREVRVVLPVKDSDERAWKDHSCSKTRRHPEVLLAPVPYRMWAGNETLFDEIEDIKFLSV
jgi:hypothetical protein